MTTKVLPNNKKNEKFQFPNCPRLKEARKIKLKIKNFEKLFLKNTKVNLFKNPQKKAFKILDSLFNVKARTVGISSMSNSQSIFSRDATNHQPNKIKIF